MRRFPRGLFGADACSRGAAHPTEQRSRQWSIPRSRAEVPLRGNGQATTPGHWQDRFSIHRRDDEAAAPRLLHQAVARA
ncbi:hypothetical protein G6F65_023198 [Rhizopus arrhizus]|nr:hypothetical protein G6F65_023198 [Rhizopus arrhizus]